MDYRLDDAKGGPVGVDGKQPFKRRKPALIKCPQHRLCNEDAFFYHRLLHQHHWPSEDHWRHERGWRAFSNLEGSFRLALVNRICQITRMA